MLPESEKRTLLRLLFYPAPLRRAQYLARSRYSVLPGWHRNRLVHRTHFTDEVAEPQLIRGVDAVCPSVTRRVAGRCVHLSCPALLGGHRAPSLRLCAMCSRAAASRAASSSRRHLARPAPPRPARTPTRKAAATPRSEPSAPRVGPLARGVSTATVTRMTCVGATVQGPRGRARAEGERAQRGARGRALPGRVSLCAGPRGLRQV